MPLSENLKRQRLRNLLARLDNDEALLRAYLSRVDRATARALGADPRLIAALLAEREAARTGAPPALRSPLYQAPLVCPGHPGREAFKGWFSLGHQRLEENLFGVTRSLGGLDGYASVDYILLEAQVCPACRYASPFRQDFGKPGTRGPERAGEVLEALSSPAARAERAGLPGPGDATAFADPARGPEVAQAAFRLALASARTARGAAETAGAYKEAYIRLRLARLDEDAGQGPSARAQYEGALEAYLAYRSVELPHELLARTTRQIVALAVLLGQDTLAKQMRSHLFEARTKASRRADEQEAKVSAARREDPESIPEALTRAGEEAAKALAAYTKHFAQADEVWQDREQHRFRG